MVALEDKGNGDVISCVVFILEDLVSENNAIVTIETLHEDHCNLFKYMEEKGFSNEKLDNLHPTSEEALEHLYSCTCNMKVEALFAKYDGETLLVPFSLNDVKAKHPFLQNKEATKEMLEGARELGSESELIKSMKLLFSKREGFNAQAFGYRDPNVH